jgi:hypothetical protein
MNMAARYTDIRAESQASLTFSTLKIYCPSNKMLGGTQPKSTAQLQTKWARHLRNTAAVQGALALARSTYEKPAPKPKPKKPKAAPKPKAVPKAKKARAKKVKVIAPPPPPPPEFKEPASLTPPLLPAEFLDRLKARAVAEATSAISPAAPAYKKAPPGVRNWLRYVWTFHRKNPSLTRQEAVQAAAAEYAGHPNDYSHPKHEYPESENDFAD